MKRGWFLQQENVPKHTLKSTMDNVKRTKLKVLPWPSRSPNVNIIQNLWIDLKRTVHARQTKNLRTWRLLQGQMSQKPSNENWKTLRYNKTLESVILAKGGVTEDEGSQISASALFYFCFSKAVKDKKSNLAWIDKEIASSLTSCYLEITSPFTRLAIHIRRFWPTFKRHCKCANFNGKTSKSCWNISVVTNLILRLEEKSVRSILRAPWICIKFHDHPFYSCWHISVWIDWQTMDWHCHP